MEIGDKVTEKTTFRSRLSYRWKSVTFKTVILSVTIVLIAVATVSSIVIRHEIAMVKTELVIRGHLLSRYLANISYDGVINEDEYLLIENVELLMNEPDVKRVEILNSKGVFVGHSDRSLFNKKLKDFVPIRISKHTELDDSYIFYFPLVEGARGYVDVQISKKRLNDQIISISLQLGLIALVIVFISIFATAFFSIKIMNPIRLLIKGAKEISNKNYDYRIDLNRNDEWQNLSEAFDDMSAKVQEFTVNLETKVMERTEELHAAMEELEVTNTTLIETSDALWGEMEIAKKIQTVLLPVKPEMKGYDISASLEPTDKVGGDYYDIINVEGYNWIIIGDVSGHGVPAGLIMMMTQTAIHTVLSENPDLSTYDLLRIVNKSITANIKKLSEDKYMTITVLAAFKDGVFSFCGLHQDILIYRAINENVEEIVTNGIWIGVIPDISKVITSSSLKLELGDCMVLFTDGITEAWLKESIKDKRDTGKEMFGQKKLEYILQRSGYKSTNEIKNEILKSMEDYDCDDDVTLVIIKRLM